MTETLVDFTLDEAIAIITLNRPHKLNALNPQMLEALFDIFSTIEERTDIRVVILTGAGERAFCVGADIHAWSALEPIDMWRQWVRYGHRVMNRIDRLRQPVIAALNGMTFGGGLELALAADIRIAVDAAEFAMPEVTIGTVPGWGGTQRLPCLIGTGRAAEMILTGQRINAAVAERWGLVNRLTPSNDLMRISHEIAQSIAANAPMSVQIAKELIKADARAGFSGEALAGALMAFTEDGKEGSSSFREKRSPRFAGK